MEGFLPKEQKIVEDHLKEIKPPFIHSQFFVHFHIFSSQVARRPIIIVHLIEDAADLAITNLARMSLTKNTIRVRDFMFFFSFSSFFSLYHRPARRPTLALAANYALLTLLFRYASSVYESSGFGEGLGEKKGLKS